MNDQCAHVKRSTFYYYRSTGKRMIHLVEERADGVLRAYQCIEHDHLTQIDAALMAAFLKKNPKSKGIIAAPISAAMSMNSVDFIPWEKAWAGVED